jgi:hypothetical protein
MVVHTCNCSTQEAETRDQEFEASMDNIVRPCLNDHSNKKLHKWYYD